LHNNVGSPPRVQLWLLEDLRLGRKEPKMIIGVDYPPELSDDCVFDERDR
jgi:hypothetical protein